MLSTSMKIFGFGFAIALALGFAAPSSHSEIAVSGAKTVPKSVTKSKAAAAKDQRVSLGASHWVQCWQHGVKIIDEKNIFDIRLQKLVVQDNLGFRGRDSNSGDILVVPLNGESTCLIKPLR